MGFSRGQEPELDDTDLRILAMLQDDCRVALARIGEQVGSRRPSVLERIKKLEAGGRDHRLPRRRSTRGGSALDVTAFIGVITSAPELIEQLEQQIAALDDVLECHHVTGEYTLLLKVKTANTSSLERLISQIRSIDGVARTETTVVLSTHAERSQLNLHAEELPPVPQAPARPAKRRAHAAARARVRRETP